MNLKRAKRVTLTLSKMALTSKAFKLTQFNFLEIEQALHPEEQPEPFLVSILVNFWIL